MQTDGQLPYLYPLLAQAIKLDLYSYEYEVMQTETIVYSNTKGLITKYINNGLFDSSAFEAAWKEHDLVEILQLITRQHLDIDNLQQHPKLKNALMDAYRHGKKHSVE